MRYLNPVYLFQVMVARFRHMLLEKRMERQFAEWDRKMKEGN